jgi:radical SAM protein with 4Fe4S-binding SPASM domain
LLNRVPPKVLSIAITPFCNLNCNFCYTSSKNGDNLSQVELLKPLLTLNQWQNILNEAKTLGYGHLHIFGGEPFLYPQLETFCLQASKIGFSIQISTNGISFKNGDESWLSDLSVNISFTINEISLKWENQPEIKQFWLNLLQSRNINTTIATCLTTKNIDEYGKFVKNLSQKSDYRKLGYFGIYYSQIGRGKLHPSLSVDPKKWISIVDQLSDNPQIQIEQSFLNKNQNDPNTFYPKGCQISSKNMLTVDWEGKIYPCFLMLNNPEALIGRWYHSGDLQQSMEKLTDNWIADKFPCNPAECPAYLNEENIDFRRALFKQKNEIERSKYTLLCPLITLR